MQILMQWAAGYFPRNYTDVFQGLVFAGLTVWLIFRGADWQTKFRKGILSFLVSYNSAQMISSLLYAVVTVSVRVNGTLLDFLTATVCLLLPLLPLIYGYKKIIGVRGPVAVFIYTLFFNANCMAMLIAMTTLQRLCITVVLSLLLTWIFREELRYILTQESMLRTDKRFNGTAIAFMILIGAEAELPRIVINGGADTSGNQLAYAVALVGAVLIVLFVIFMKFNFFAIMQYENYIRKHDDDPATCARSFSYLLGHGPLLVRKSAKMGQQLAVFYTDISNLRDVNIMHGYDAGNIILQKLASAVTEEFPDGIIARASGTHFTGMVPLQGSRQRFQHILAFTEQLSIDENLTLKVGLRPLKSETYTGEVDFKDVLTWIDQASAAVRYLPESESGIQSYDAQMRQNEEIRLHVLASLDEAVRSGWLRVYYQPIVKCETGKVAAYEALSRWIDPKYGFLTPDKFIVPLENMRMIYKVDLNVLRSFGREAQRLSEMGIKVLPISFNLSRTDLEADIDVLREIERIVRVMHLSRDLVHIEITESALNGNSSAMEGAVRRIHDMGFEVWMDDFGAGYSSLNVLKDYRFDVIKIDMEFMRKFDTRSREIVRSICQMAAAIGTRTVAEGVETEEQYAFLKDIGCTYAQGYLFSKPLPAEEIYHRSPSLRGWH